MFQVLHGKIIYPFYLIHFCFCLFCNIVAKKKSQKILYLMKLFVLCNFTKQQFIEVVNVLSRDGLSPD